MKKAKAVLVRAVQNLMMGGNVSSMLKAKLRPMILQLDPEFEPTSYDFLTFNDFITGCLDNV